MPGGGEINTKSGDGAGKRQSSYVRRGETSGTTTYRGSIQKGERGPRWTLTKLRVIRPKARKKAGGAPQDE